MEEESGADLEVEALQREYRWVLRKEVQHAITFLRSVLQECKTRLPSTSSDTAPLQEEKFIMNPANGGDFLKCVVGLVGNRVTKADVTFKFVGKNPVQMMKFGIPPEYPYLLQQFQDAYNCISEALVHLASRDLEDDDFQTAEEVIKLIQPVSAYLTHARTVLVVPKKRSFEELKAAAHRRHFVPPLPSDMSASLYIQAHKLIFALYQVLPGAQKFDCFQAEVSIPWLTETLVLMTVALQTCQQLLDKMNIFVQNLDLNQKSLD